MTTSKFREIMKEYMINKNKVTTKYLKINIIKKSHINSNVFKIEDVETIRNALKEYLSRHKSDKYGATVLNILNCTYCTLFNNSEEQVECCIGCPIDTGGDNCLLEDSRWSSICDKQESLNYRTFKKFKLELITLVEDTLEKMRDADRTTTKQ